MKNLFLLFVIAVCSCQDQPQELWAAPLVVKDTAPVIVVNCNDSCGLYEDPMLKYYADSLLNTKP